MERLTYKGKTKNKVYCEYEMQDAINKLADYEDKEEQGLLVELPCKVGDKVWFIRTSSGKPELVETEIEKVVLKKRGMYVQLSCNSFYETTCNSIDKTVFFTEAEAEEALAKMGGTK